VKEERKVGRRRRAPPAFEEKANVIFKEPAEEKVNIIFKEPVEEKANSIFGAPVKAIVRDKSLDEQNPEKRITQQDLDTAKRVAVLQARKEMEQEKIAQRAEELFSKRLRIDQVEKASSSATRNNVIIVIGFFVFFFILRKRNKVKKKRRTSANSDDHYSRLKHELL